MFSFPPFLFVDEARGRGEDDTTWEHMGAGEAA